MTEPQPAGGTRPHDADSAARRVVAQTVLISVALGLVVGLVWWLAAPEVSVGVSGGQSVLNAAEARKLFGVDASFAPDPLKTALRADIATWLAPPPPPP